MILSFELNALLITTLNYASCQYMNVISYFTEVFTDNIQLLFNSIMYLVERIQPIDYIFLNIIIVCIGIIIIRLKYRGV